VECKYLIELEWVFCHVPPLCNVQQVVPFRLTCIIPISWSWSVSPLDTTVLQTVHSLCTDVHCSNIILANYQSNFSFCLRFNSYLYKLHTLQITVQQRYDNIRPVVQWSDYTEMFPWFSTRLFLKWFQVLAASLSSIECLYSWSLIFGSLVFTRGFSFFWVVTISMR
jgi:hypothetical protein